MKEFGPKGNGGSNGEGGARDTRPAWGSKFFQFHAVFGKIWQIRMLALPRGVAPPLLGEILDPPLQRGHVPGTPLDPPLYPVERTFKGIVEQIFYTESGEYNI